MSVRDTGWHEPWLPVLLKSEAQPTMVSFVGMLSRYTVELDIGIALVEKQLFNIFSTMMYGREKEV